MADRIQIRRGISADWTTINPILADGEIGIERDLDQAPKFKVGNGSTNWNNLPYGIQGETGPQGLQGLQGETGPQGLQGLQGETGPQGLQGDPGLIDAQVLLDITGSFTTPQKETFRTNIGGAIVSDVSGLSGATLMKNAVFITQVGYDAIVSPDVNTLYVIVN